eukprot:TRINITY_DN2845_c0_g3_i2.p1 TRINITY_DN2845_c0_g3~~TRINITY_DN2845_c0_g3_i2.p1  ORF type:complete len:349 (+),score=50.49 TRINITY_DN2845_c0_g3_i2:112-1158(+)
MDKKKIMEKFLSVVDTVYGKYTEPTTSARWKPKPYTDNKSRYLWTDAYGVCNFLTLYYEFGSTRFLDQADALIDDVHNVLGKDRKAQNRLADSTEEHPLRGGLRIGKIDPEDSPDGDGQYFHYLTKWAFALNRMSMARKEKRYNDWAIDLIKAIHSKFIYRTSEGTLRMVWKMSIDLKRPAVRSEGNLDPFDGYVTYRLVQESASDPNVLQKELKDMESMVMNKYKRYTSDDPLDLGEALWISHWYPEEDWSKFISSRSLKSLEGLWSMGYFNAHPKYRLAFREFGTTIGVQVHPHASQDWKNRVEQLHTFWSEFLFKRDSDISPVMFCTSLNPGIFWKSYPDNKKLH